MATIPSRSNISYPTEINQRFFNNRQLIADIYEKTGKILLSKFIIASESTKENTNELIDLTNKLVDHLCTIDNSESLKLIFKLHARKLILDTDIIKIVLRLKKSNIKLKD